jgi:nucleoside-diphosphate-sugar epimerase
VKILITGGSGFIGTNVVSRLLTKGHEVLNFSLHAPHEAGHRPFWKEGDILEADLLRQTMTGFAPDQVMHLAARTEMDEKTTAETGFRANTQGTRNFLAAVQATPSIRRMLMCSSQFVCGPGRLPAHDEDYFPATVYGQSKVITEQETRRNDLRCEWVMVRPTNIWGPWHPRYPQEFWRIARKGLYVHPGGKPVVRCYGYVGNVADQMVALLEQPAEKIDRQTFYIGDPAGDIYHWADAFCRALHGKPARKVPRPILRTAGLAGDIITALTGKPFYITSSRYRSMVTDYVTPMDQTYALLGQPKFSLEQGVAETVTWLRTQPEFQPTTTSSAALCQTFP